MACSSLLRSQHKFWKLQFPLYQSPVQISANPNLRNYHIQKRWDFSPSSAKLILHSNCTIKFNVLNSEMLRKRSFSLDRKGEEELNRKEDKESSSPETSSSLSLKQRLKQAVKDYGSTVLVFHITMSLCSLGMFYLLVSSGLDLAALLSKLGLDESVINSKVTQGASTFVVAYAVHKIFAPVRITITLTATPFIVTRLRTMGILKPPVPK